MNTYKEILAEAMGNKKEYTDYKQWKKAAENKGYKVIEHLTDKNGNPGNLSVAKDKDGNRQGEFTFDANSGRTDLYNGWLK